jgi:hypothetical protein
VVNFASDLIQFVSNDNVSNGNSGSSASAAAELSTSHGTSGNSGDTHIPSSSDVAALEAMATPVEDSSKQSGHSGNSDSSSAGSASGSNSGSASHDMVALLHDLSGGNSSGGGSVHGGDAAPSANDNSTPHFGDTALAIASGYGNDVADYMTADEQAALVPEPISALFEALQFANAFNDASNGDVMMFDAANVVTISQFQSPDCHHSHHDLPLI